MNNQSTIVPSATIWGIASAMVTGMPIRFTASTGQQVSGIVNRVEREDGSGQCWNVTMQDGETYFVRVCSVK
jgi:hypothetical protein